MRMRGGGRAHRSFRMRGIDGGSTERGPYRIRGQNLPPATPYITTVAVEVPVLAIPLTFYGPRIGTFTTVGAAHLTIPMTFFQPKVVSAVRTSLLAIPINFYPPTVKFVPPPTYAYFTPPIAPYLKLPPVPRTDWLMEMQLASGMPRSARYRQFLGTQVGVDITIAGVFYGGGRWHGPLTATQIAAITAAGYGARIVMVRDVGLLPAGID